jgi:nitrogen fixation NifU-like protein
VKGKTVGETRQLLRRFKSMMSIEGNDSQPGDNDVELGDLEALQGVVKFPVRIKCAVLGWNTLAQGLDATAPAEP